MLKSMTGYGEATSGTGRKRCTVEIRALNHRYLEITPRLPQALTPLEAEIRMFVQSRIKRGKIHLSVSLNNGDPQSEELDLDEQKVLNYYRQLVTMARRLRIDSRISLSDLLAFPNIFVLKKRESEVLKRWPEIRRTMNRALGRLLTMKIREGQALKKELVKRLSLIRSGLGRIKRLSTDLVIHYQNRLRERVRELTEGLEMDREMLAKEVSLLADRSDVTEETVRLDNHLRLFREALQEDSEAGKKLDFITQEMNREANTIASKALSFPVSREIVKIKAEIEKIREQVQNIE
jgi:uncharacterized protein (TIGR00255 family)